jgi:hypothetical protein
MTLFTTVLYFFLGYFEIEYRSTAKNKNRILEQQKAAYLNIF